MSKIGIDLCFVSVNMESIYLIELILLTIEVNIICTNFLKNSVIFLSLVYLCLFFVVPKMYIRLLYIIKRLILMCTDFCFHGKICVPQKILNPEISFYQILIFLFYLMLNKFSF